MLLFVAVILIGGKGYDYIGNVYAYNTETRVFGSVCGTSWTQENVSKQCLHFKWQQQDLNPIPLTQTIIVML